MKHQSYISVPLFFLMVSSLVIARVSIASNITYVDSADQKSFSSENLSYVPVYYISDKKVSERIQIIENKKLKEKAVNNVSEGKAVLTEVICK